MLSSDPPSPEECPWIDEFLAQAMPPAGARQIQGRVAVNDYPAGRSLLGLDRPQRASAAVDALLRLAATREGSGTYSFFLNRRALLRALALRLVKASTPLAEEEAVGLARAAGRLGGHRFWEAPVGALLAAFESHAAAHGLSPALRLALSEIQPKAPPGSREKSQWVQLQALARGEVRRETAEVEIRPGEAWADALRRELAAAPPASAAAWQELLQHLRSATASAPSERWMQRAGELVRAVGEEAFAHGAALSLRQIGKPGTRPVDSESGAHDTRLDPGQSDLLRGLVWSTAALGDPRLAAALGDAAQACFQKFPNVGARDVKIGNACLQALGRSSEEAAVAQLGRLLVRFKAGSVHRTIERTLDGVARRAGLSAGELQEITVPGFDMSEAGVRRELIGGFTAELRLTGAGETELRWIARDEGDGKAQKAVPAAVRAEHPGELAALRKLQKEIEALLSAQRDRIDQLYLSSRSWDLPTWRARYLDHPLVGVLARRLIWRFGTGAAARLGAALDGPIVDVRDEPFGDLAPETPVALWHPLESPAAEVLAWRRWLAERQVRQPFKQAHREIYVLTDAEHGTDPHSLRFASHLLRQHPFAALCGQRGWSYRLQGAWDSFNLPCRTLPEHGLRAELRVEPLAEEVAASGIYLYLSTGPLRFTSLAGEPLPLDAIPRRVFSELMRDVDLFVSVASVGQDPDWEARHTWGAVPWQRESFGDLGATAVTRREILAGLLPRLRIAGRCSLAGRFLVVRGDLRTYQIHLGSGNVLMQPNDQYLCIVPKGAPAGALLPFEGDRTFSVILSKAFLLAEDTKISDPTILSQIRTR